MAGNRVVLRRWREADRGPFAVMNVDPDVIRYFPAGLSRPESDALIDRIEDAFETNGYGMWALEIEGRFAGFTGLGRIAFDSPIGPEIEVGWRLAPWAWGRGYATEAAGLCLEFAFSQLGARQIYAFTTESNARSEAVMKRLGMTRRSDLDFDHPRTPGWWGQRHIVYAICAEEWPESGQRHQ